METSCVMKVLLLLCKRERQATEEPRVMLLQRKPAVRSAVKTELSQRCRFIGALLSTEDPWKISRRSATPDVSAANHTTRVTSIVEARHASHLSARVAATGSHRTAAGAELFCHLNLKRQMPSESQKSISALPARRAQRRESAEPLSLFLHNQGYLTHQLFVCPLTYTTLPPAALCIFLRWRIKEYPEREGGGGRE